MGFTLLTKKKSVVICDDNELQGFLDKKYKVQRQSDSLQVLELAKADILGKFKRKRNRRVIYAAILSFGLYSIYEYNFGIERAEAIFAGKKEASRLDLCIARTQLSFIAIKAFDSMVDGDMELNCLKLERDLD